MTANFTVIAMVASGVMAAINEGEKLRAMYFMLAGAATC